MTIEEIYPKIVRLSELIESEEVHQRTLNVMRDIRARFEENAKPDGNENIAVEITDASEFHCFKLILNPRGSQVMLSPQRIEIMLHARSLVDLIYKCSIALCNWQASTSQELIDGLTKIGARGYRLGDVDNE